MAGYNRERDAHVAKPVKKWNLSCEDENYFIKRLLQGFQHFQDNQDILDLPYSAFPSPGENQFNSNSFVHSLLNYSGLNDNLPMMPHNPGWTQTF